MPYDRQDVNGTFQVRYYGTEEPLAISDQWSSKYKSNSGSDKMCVAASLGKMKILTVFQVLIRLLQENLQMTAGFPPPVTRVRMAGTAYPAVPAPFLTM
jgi:hypothetical protein